MKYLGDYMPLNLRNNLRDLLVNLRMKPFFDIAQIALTYRCNAHCSKCSIKKYKKNENELTTKEIKSVIYNLSKIGVGKLGFFGGEPMLRKDLYILIAYASKKGIKTELITNGYYLTKKNIKKLKDSGISMVSVSIDSSNEKIHDRLRNLRGCYRRAVNGIELCVDNKITTVINTVATKENIRNGDLKKIVHLGKELNVDKVKLIPPTMIGGWIDSRNVLLEDSDKNEIIKLKKTNFVISEVAKIGKKMYRQCRCRTNSRLFISCYGDVQPCWAVPISFGNIRNKSLIKIVNSMKSFKSNTASHDCIVNDQKFRRKFLKNINSKTEIPVQIIN